MKHFTHMVFGRIFGWLLIGLAIVLASGEAVLALTPGAHPGIVTGELVTLFSGLSRPEQVLEPPTLRALSLVFLNLPAWLVVGTLGLALCRTCRRRPRRFRFRPG